MQEEVTQKTVTFCIRTTKVTADLLKKVLAAYLRHQKQKSVEKKAKKNQPKQGLFPQTRYCHCTAQPLTH